MLAPKARWKIRAADQAVVKKLVSEARLSDLAAAVLAARGTASAEEANAFLSDEPEPLHDPLLLDGMKQAAERIRQAVDQGDKIRIYGDYDADGVSSTSLMIALMKQLNADWDHYIPHRVNEGYGLNEAAVEAAADSGVGLIVTVDTGISAVAEIAYAADLGIDVVVTDHHEPPETLPEANALVNPRKPGCPYPFKGLAGVGVALKLAQALLGDVPEFFFQWAALGTIADLMPLTGENRSIVKRGLASLRREPLPGLRALCEIADVPVREAGSGHIAFAIAPRINASGRLEHADDAVRLLTAATKEDALPIARRLDELNRERQQLVEEIVAAAQARIGDQPDGQVLVVSDPGWNIGVLGIVASKLLERYYRPVIVLGEDPASGTAKGSARSIPGFDIVQALRRAEDLLQHYGGHQAAAGMTLAIADIPALRERLCATAAEMLTPQDFIPEMHADGQVGVEAVTLEAIEQIERLAPFGNGNPTPRIVLANARIREIRTLGKEGQHLKLALEPSEGASGAAALDALAFGEGTRAGAIAPTSRIDVLGELGINEWNGARKPQIIVRDMRIAHVQLFDWRGRRDAGEAIRRSAAGADSPEEHGILLFPPWAAGGTAGEPRAESGGLRQWLKSRGADPVALAGGDDRLRERVRHLYVHALPPDEEEFAAALAAFPDLRCVYAVFREPDEAVRLPGREGFKRVYALLRQLRQWRANEPGWLERMSRKTGLTAGTIRFMLDVFEELAFIERDGESGRIADSPGKRALETSRLFQERMQTAAAAERWNQISAEELAEWIRARQPLSYLSHGRKADGF